MTTRRRLLAVAWLCGPFMAWAGGASDFFVSESDGTGIAYDASSAVIANVTGKGLAPDESLALVESVITGKTAAGVLEPARRVVAALCVSRGIFVFDAKGRPLSAGVPDFARFAPPQDPRLQRFLVALCDGELPGVPVARRDGKASGWVHFLEGDRQALYFLRGSMVEVAPGQRALRVRLDELGGGQLSDGRRFDARNAVWVLDCRARTGAVAYEKYLARSGQQSTTIDTFGAESAWTDPKGIDPAGLKFAKARQGSIQGRFTDVACNDTPAR